MTKILAIFLVCFLFVLPLRLSFAEEQMQHFSIQLEPMYMSGQGIDEHLQDTVKRKVKMPYDVTDNLSIGPTTLFSICYNGPVTPASRAIDRCREDFWWPEKRTVKLSGVGLALNVRF